jgi:hypothetical protein
VSGDQLKAGNRLSGTVQPGVLSLSLDFFWRAGHIVDEAELDE